jgi:aryl-alcohol dehydrogenase-like predicted oxidoreductase
MKRVLPSLTLGRGMLSAQAPKVEEMSADDIRAHLPRFHSANAENNLRLRSALEAVARRKNARSPSSPSLGQWPRARVRVPSSYRYLARNRASKLGHSTHAFLDWYVRVDARHAKDIEGVNAKVLQSSARRFGADNANHLRRAPRLSCRRVDCRSSNE